MPVDRSAGAVIFRETPKKEKEYLLLHYTSGHWDFPKGMIEKGETTDDTVRREVLEETGVSDIECIPGFKETIRYFVKHENERRLKFVAFFLARTPENQEVKISWEHQGYQWLPYEKAYATITYKNAKDVLQKAYNFLHGKSV